MKKRHVCAFCLCAAFTASCASAPQLGSALRTRQQAFDAQNEATKASETVAFVPKGVYLRNVRPPVKQGDWVRLLPSGRWREDEPPPTILVGRVAEMLGHDARLEILSAAPDIRAHGVRMEVYAPQNGQISLHAMTKRLAFGIDISANQAILPIGTYDLITGDEIYAVCAVNSRAEERLSSQCTGLMTVLPDGMGTNEVRLSLVAGHIPDNPSFVLMDAVQTPSFRVQIAVSDGLSPLNHELSTLLRAPLPGVQFIDIVSSPNIRTANIHQTLGDTATDRLDVVLYGDQAQILMADQGLRVDSSPWRVIIDGNHAQLASLSAVTTALDMLGYDASVSYLLEQAWRETQDAALRAAMAPALAHAYHAMERDDWALEIALEMIGEAKRQKTCATRAKAWTAAAAVVSMTERADEFADVYRAARDAISCADARWKKVLAHALAAAGETQINAYRMIERELLNKNQWDETDELAVCMNHTTSELFEETCSQGSEHATSKYAQLWYATQARMKSNDMAALPELVSRVDDMGAPQLARELWMTIALHGGADVENIWANAAAYAQTAQQRRTFADMMLELARYMSVRHEPIEAALFSEALDSWRALDKRMALAAVCVWRAQQLQGDEAIALLNFAEELYASTGDAENLALVRDRRTQRLTRTETP